MFIQSDKYNLKDFKKIAQCEPGFRAVQIWLFEYNTDPWMFNMAPHGK